MKKLLLVFIFGFYIYAYAGIASASAEPRNDVERAVQSDLAASGNVTLDFKEADINNVLKIISYKSGVNIVTTPDVIGNISVRLSDVPWELALDVILKTYGFGYQKQGNVILVTKVENVAKIAADEPLQTEIITLKFLDAQDAQKIIIPLLSPRGKISVLYNRGQKGWVPAPDKIGDVEVRSTQVDKVKEEIKPESVSIERDAAGKIVSTELKFDPVVKSKMLVITDTASTLDKIRNIVLPKIDVKPQQVLIETRIIEVSLNKLRDIGLDWGLGGNNTARLNTITMQEVASGKDIGGHGGTVGGTATSNITPSLFGPATTSILGYEPYNAGAEFVFQKLTGTKFEAVIHALEDDSNTNTLSAPSILTLDNQEASMFIGYHTPILKSVVTAGSTTDGVTTGGTVTQSLGYYQAIGISLNVVPQISEQGYVNLIIYSSISSSVSSITATSTAGGIPTTTSYPVIDMRKAQTQVLLKDKETIVIGGLLKDVKGKEFIGIPFLKDLPWIGKFFGRETNSTKKIDLLIFITAKVIKEGELTPEEIAKLEKRLDRAAPADKTDKKNKTAVKKEKITVSVIKK